MQFQVTEIVNWYCSKTQNCISTESFLCMFKDSNIKSYRHTKCLFNFNDFVLGLAGYSNDHFIFDETLSLLFAMPSDSLLLKKIRQN